MVSADLPTPPAKETQEEEEEQEEEEMLLNYLCPIRNNKNYSKVANLLLLPICILSCFLCVYYCCCYL
jgi:hypothetical protein